VLLDIPLEKIASVLLPLATAAMEKASKVNRGRSKDAVEKLLLFLQSVAK
jgi:hypothetical protein